MAQKTRAVLKTSFETGDIPTQADFANSIDSSLNILDDTLDVIAEGATSKIYTATEKTKLLGIEAGAQVSNVEVTDSEFQILVSGSTLIPDTYYKITDATSTNEIVLVYADGVNTFRPKVDLLSDSFDVVYMTIETGLIILRCWDDIEFVARNTGGTWGLITTGGHTPKGVSGVVNEGTNGFRVTYTRTSYTDVGSLIVGVDEVYASLGVTAGSSVGLLFSDVEVYREDKIAGRINWTGAAWQILPSGAVDSAVTSGAGFNVTLTHDACELYTGNLSNSAARTYIPCLNATATTTTVVSFMEGAVQVTAENTLSNFYFTRNISGVYLNTDSDDTNSNLWGKGSFMQKKS